MATDTDTFEFERSFNLPADKMWHLITSNEGREAWGAPGDHILETLLSDFRVGGVERARCGPADNPEFEVETRWFHIADGECVVYTEQIEAGGMALGASLVTTALTPTDKGTDVSFTVAVSSFVGPEMIAEFRNGWEGGLENLDKLAAKEV